MGSGLRSGQRVIRLRRSAKQRRHLLRTMVTQLVEHERITTTLHKAKALQQIADHVLAIGKGKPNQLNITRAKTILTTNFASKKLFLELAPRFKDRTACYTRVVKMGRRKGDNAQMAYVEYLNNDIDKYEKTLEKQNLENGLVPNKEEFERKTFTQERDFFKEKLNEVEEEEVALTARQDALAAEGKADKFKTELKNIQIKKQFFQKKLQQVEHDLFITNKNKYDLIKFATYSA